MASPEGGGDNSESAGDNPPERRLRQPAPRHRRLTPRVLEPVPPQEPVHVLMQRAPDRVSGDELDVINQAARGQGEFVEKNPTFADYERQTPHERGDALASAEKQNAAWIAAAFSALPHLAWIEVLDGRVVSAGRSTSDMPDDLDLYDEGRTRGTVSYRFLKESPMVSCAEVGREVGEVCPDL